MMWQQHKARGAQGFTLVELLLAMLIFSMIGLASAFVLNQMLSSDERSQERRQALEELQFAMLLMERDVRAMVMRPLRAMPQDRRHLYVVNDGGATDSDADGLAFVRGGWSNPNAMLPRSTLQPVVYRLRDNVLQRMTTPYVDDASGRISIQDLLHGVEDFRVSFIHEGDEVADWNTQHTLPDAVLVQIVSEEYGRIERWFLVGGQGRPATSDEGSL
jgi:general secretion pathway protein J